MAKAKTPKISDVIEETMTFQDQGKPHILKSIFDGPANEIPTLTSVGYVRLPGSSKYVSYVMTSQGTEIKKIEVSEPDHKGIAEDQAKINFVNSFMNSD